MEAGQEAVFTSVGEELDAACRSLSGDSHDKLEVRSFFLFLIVILLASYIHAVINFPKNAARKKGMPHVPKSYIIHLPPAKRNVLYFYGASAVGWERYCVLNYAERLRLRG